MLTGFFQDSDFIVVLQTGCGSGFLPLASGLESDSKKLESEHLCLTLQSRQVLCSRSSSHSISSLNPRSDFHQISESLLCKQKEFVYSLKISQTFSTKFEKKSTLSIG